MGVCLYFKSLRPVAEDVEEALRTELRQAESSQPWVLCEPPHFYETEEDGRLRGGSKLNLHPEADELAEAAGAPTGHNDLQALVQRLSDWSERHGITWLLDIDGEPLGRIQDGACRGDLLGKIEALADLSSFLGEEYPREGPEPERGEGDDPPGGSHLRLWPGPE